MIEKRILVVDDEELIREVYKQTFELAGYSVEVIEGGEEALEAMRKMPCQVLFLDLNLPGMSGADLCRQIRREWPTTIPYAVTGYASPLELSDCRDAGFEHCFTKPVSLRVLIAAAEEAFKRLEN